MTSDIAEVIRPFVARRELAGAAWLVASRSQVLTLGSVGYADLSTGKPLHSDAVFWIASMSKPIVAIAVMMLVDDGRIQLDDPVDRYLPDFNPTIMEVAPQKKDVYLRASINRMTIRHLLAHTNTPKTLESREHVAWKKRT